MLVELERDTPLFEKGVPFLVRYPDREEKHEQLVLRVLLGTKVRARPRRCALLLCSLSFVSKQKPPLPSLQQPVGGGARERLFHVEVTNEDDPFFLFTLDVNEADFHELKSDQSLLVDFIAFPSKFIELLESCLQQEVTGESDGMPSFLAVLDTQTTDGSLLSIVETNKFKHLTHLSLRFRSEGPGPCRPERCRHTRPPSARGGECCLRRYRCERCWLVVRRSWSPPRRRPRWHG